MNEASTISNTEKIISTDTRTPAIDKALLDSCIHCGICLPACPTYLATGREMESPRGRIYLLSQWQAGTIPLSDRMQDHLESCLGCLGCQTACPSGVQYEEILNQARPHLAARRSATTRFIMRFAFQNVLPRYWLLRILGFLMRAWQMLFGRDFLSRLAGGKKGNESSQQRQDTPASKMIARLSEWEKFTPSVPPQVPLPRRLAPAPFKRTANGAEAVGSETSEVDGSKTSEPVGKPNAEHNAQLFAGCIMDVFYNHVNHACIRLILMQGHSVAVPKQTCCGALAYHAGELDIATALAKRNIDYFGQSASPIVVTSAGCGAMLKHYGHLLEADRNYSGLAESFSKRVQDITEFLARHQFPAKPRALSEKTTYHAACHLAHAQNVRKEPPSLLEKLDNGPEANLTTLIEQEHCCGSAGIYNLLNTTLSLKVLDRKLDFIAQTGAKTVVTTNPGCMLQLEAGLKERGMDVEVRHLALVLDEAYSTESNRSPRVD